MSAISTPTPNEFIDFAELVPDDADLETWLATTALRAATVDLGQQARMLRVVAHAPKAAPGTVAPMRLVIAYAQERAKTNTMTAKILKRYLEAASVYEAARINAIDTGVLAS